MKLSVLAALAFCAPSIALRRHSNQSQAAADDCGGLAGVVVKGKNFGQTLETLCHSWPSAQLGKFPVSDVGRAGELLGKAVNEGGALDQIKQIRASGDDRGFCWRQATQRNESGECPLGYKAIGLTGRFTRTCKTACMWSSYPVSCGMGCATGRGTCSSVIADQALVVAQGVANFIGTVLGDDRVTELLSAVVSLAEFLLATLPQIVDAVRGAMDILDKNEQGIMVVSVLFEYLKEAVPELLESAVGIKNAIQELGATIARLATEKVETGVVTPRKIIREILDSGDAMLDYAVIVTKAFTHPKCSYTDNTAFTLEVVGDDRLLGPWVPRGEVRNRPRYTALGDRSTNLEWASHRRRGKWVMFSDGRTGKFGRRYLYESHAETHDYPLTGWTTTRHGNNPVPEFVPVRPRMP